MGLPYQLRLLPFPPRVQRKDYLAINPLGTVPWLQDGDITLSESAAMCQYLAARYGEGRWDVPAVAGFYLAHLLSWAALIGRSTFCDARAKSISS